MQTDYAGIDYGLGRTNTDHATGIRYGVIHHSSVGSAWYDASEADYGKARCPECQAEAVDYDEESHGDWPYEKHECCDYACQECEQVFGSDSAFPEEPFSYTVDDGTYLAEQSGDDYDIFVIRSPYYTWCQFCSPCAPGAGYLENWMEEGQGIKAYCFGHDWFEDGVAPYPVYSVDNGELIEPEKAA